MSHTRAPRLIQIARFFEEASTLKRKDWLLLGTSLMAFLAAGCRNEDARVYSAPKEGRPAPTTAEMPPSSAQELVDWTLPEGWQQVPGSGMRYATLIVEGGEQPLEVRVTPLGMMARDPLANVNRWREQIGLGHIGPDELGTVLQHVEIEEGSVDYINMVGPEAEGRPATQVLAAILPGQQSVWFFLLMAEAERVQKHVGTFEQFLSSLRLVMTDLATMPTDHPPIDGMPPGHPEVGSSEGSDGAPETMTEMTWKLPGGWQQQSSSSQFRLATFTVEEDGAQAEVAITKFPGGVGGMLANINRWRGQIGLAPVASLDEQPLEDIQIGDRSGGVLDLVGSAAGDSPPESAARMFVLMLPHQEMTYFIKMTGPNDLLEQQKSNFESFIQSVRFLGADS